MMMMMVMVMMVVVVVVAMVMMSFSKPLSLREWGDQPTEGGVCRLSRPAKAWASRSERGDVAAQPGEHREIKCFFCVGVRAPGVRETLLSARNGPQNAAL